MEEKLIKTSDEYIEKILGKELTTESLDNLYKLTKINCMVKKGENNMNYNDYGNYRDYDGRGPGHGSYGRYDGYREYNDGYGRRGVDSKYRGYGHLDRMYNEYGNYSYGRERYGANEDTKRSLEYMLRSMEDFARMLKEEAQSQEEVQMIKQTAQRIAQM